MDAHAIKEIDIVPEIVFQPFLRNDSDWRRFSTQRWAAIGEGVFAAWKQMFNGDTDSRDRENVASNAGILRHWKTRSQAWLNE